MCVCIAQRVIYNNLDIKQYLPPYERYETNILESNSCIDIKFGDMVYYITTH